MCVFMCVQNECRQLRCTAGKTLQNDTCSSPLSQIRGLAYHLDMSLTVPDPLAVSLDHRSQLVVQLKELTAAKLRAWTETFDLDIVMHVVLRDGSRLSGEQGEVTLPGEQNVDLQIRITGRVMALRNISRDDAERAITDSLFFHAWSVSVSQASVSQDSVSQVSVNLASVSQDSVSQTSVSQESVSQYSAHQYSVSQYSGSQDIDSGSQYSVRHTRRLSTTIDWTRVNASYQQTARYNVNHGYLHYDFTLDKLIKLSPLLACPHLAFNGSEYRLETAADNNTVVKLTLMFGDREAELVDVRRSLLDEGSLYVCLDALRNLQLHPASSGVAEVSWQYVLTMVIMPLSMLCLLLTLAVHCLLPALRTQPGLNTMCTCIALLLAQLSLLLAAHTDGTRTARPWCQVLGAVLHASWLHFFCWTSICSLHMFRAFSAQTYHHGLLSSTSCRQYRETVCNISISVLVPAAVCGLVVVAKLLTTNGRSVGYSAVSCYLENVLLVGVAMVLPASLLLLLNLTLFALTVRRIHEVAQLLPRSQDEQESQRHLYACARLSLLTGITWIVALVAEGLNVDWLRLISILANGGQGVMLLLSHATTGRIFAMLAVKMGWKLVERSSPSQSTNATFRHSENA
ncbi:hypothetical protein V1264_013549 [Littorina saxatilis]|uniref:G-protein coupled receptors family 2 profile 2 domain-containing protein n=1 Tax=Littorina saxatilis TaxID=31220 RepID=A0AAN9GJZ9_9CAEN